LFTKKSNRNALLIVFILLNGKQLTGIGPIDAYAQLIFEEIFDTLSPLLITLIYYFTRLVMVIVSSFLTDRVGRRPMLFVSFFGSFLSLFLLSCFLYVKNHNLVDTSHYAFLPILFLEGFAVFYSLLTSIPLSVLGELFPMNVKVFASIFYEVYLYAITLSVIKCFQVMSDNFGMESAFLTFSLSCLVHLFFIYKFVLETKGRTLNEIQKYLHCGLTRK
jgi:MFS family permease